jgi:hypothetical protein
MASIQEATKNAIAFAKAILGPERTVDARLEEIESTKVGDEDAWLITLSMIRQDDVIGNIAPVLSKRREYKSFTVRKTDGEVTAMKIRELADA